MTGAAICLGIVIVIVIVIAVTIVIVATANDRREKLVSSFQFWSRDPSYGSPPLQNPWAPRSEMIRSLDTIDDGDTIYDTIDDGDTIYDAIDDGDEIYDAIDDGDEIYDAVDDGDEIDNTEAWYSPARYAAPLWYSAPFARYYWKYTPYYRYGQTPSYYGSYPYYATW